MIALVVGLLGGVLRLGSRAWERGEQALETQQRSRDLMAFLTQELRSVYPYQVKLDATPVYFFQGADDRVRFVSTLADPFPDGRAPFRVVSFFAEPGQGLLVQSAPLLGAGLPEEGPAHLLDRRVRALRLRYLVKEGWVSSWEPKEVPPAASQAGALRARPGGNAAGPEPAPAIPRAVEVTVTLDSSVVLGPITVPVFAGMELKKTNPAGGGAS